MKAVKKSTRKKATLKKPTLKKPTLKKAAVKKATPKKSAVKKSAAKAKKPISKKSVKSKPAVSKAAPVKPKVVEPPKPAMERPLTDEEFTKVELEKRAQNIDYAMCIAEAMKKAKQKNDKGEDGKIRLPRRPVTRVQGKNTIKFSDSDLKDFRKKLLLAREKACAGVDVMQSAGFNEADDHESDGGDGTAQTSRLQALGQVGNIKRQIQQIDEALHRIDDGSYGVCTVCGQLIRKARLLNQPFVLTCVECQDEFEKSTR